MNIKVDKLKLLILCVVIGWFLLSGRSDGQTWVQIRPHFTMGDTLVDFSRGMFATKEIGWLVRNWHVDSTQEYNSRIYKTLDGGTNWSLQKELDGLYSFELCFVYDSLHAWFVGSGVGQLIRTTDGGITWDSASITDKYLGNPFGAVHFFNTLEGIAINKFPWLTTDGGMHWKKGDTTHTLNGPTDLAFVDRNNGWVSCSMNPIVMDEGVIAKTTDGGNTWSYQGDTSLGVIHTCGMFGIDCIDTNRAYAAGTTSLGTGRFYWTDDGGKGWHGPPLGTELFDVSFLNRDTGWIVSWSGLIRQTTDAGATWTIYSTGLNSDLKKVRVLRKERVVYVQGTNHVLLRADIIEGVSHTFDGVPTHFLLSQNYPNPFNPSTTISYQLPKSSTVTLKVFDVLGREVATLVNGKQTTGFKSITWDAANVPSGMYFYRLIAGSFIETRKLVVVR
jgi:photosystem II stability/assembly factor-like uncharacterized protein